MTSSPAGFDDYAAEYDAALDQGIRVSGECKDYFARSRIEWLRACLKALQERPSIILDYGCGTGLTTSFFRELVSDASVLGVDVSSKSLDFATRLHGSDGIKFLLFDQYTPNAEIDLAFCNGVFHHILPRNRASAIDYIYRSLRPGGLFALWENNPWNPGTRYVMRRIPFDRDAIPLPAPETRQLLCAGGFDIIRIDFLFIFPRALRWFRTLEPLVSKLPLGAQYQVLCRKPFTMPPAALFR